MGLFFTKNLCKKESKRFIQEPHFLFLLWDSKRLFQQKQTIYANKQQIYNELFMQTNNKFTMTYLCKQTTNLQMTYLCKQTTNNELFMQTNNKKIIIKNEQIRTMK